MLVSFVVWTACSAVFAKTASAAAGLTVVVFIFVYFYFYGKSHAVMVVFWLVLTTHRYCLHPAPFRIPDGDLPLLTPSQGADSRDDFDLRQLGDPVVCQSDCVRQAGLAIFHCILCLAGIHIGDNVVLVPRDERSQSGRDR